MKKRGKYTYSDILFGNGSTVSLVSTFILFLPVFLQLIWQIQNQGLPISDQGNLYNSAFEIYFKFKIGLKEGIHFIFHDSGRPILFSAFAAPLIPLSFIDENLPIIAFITIVQSITCISYYLIFSSRIGKIKSALLAGLITTSPYIYNLHNLFTSEILWHMFFAISLYFLLNLFKTNKTYYQISAGTCLAFCALARPIESLILLSPIIIIYFFLLHKEKNLNLNVLILNFSISTILLVSSSIVNWFKINQFVGLSFLILVNILFIFRNYFFKQFDNKKTLKNNLNLKSSYSYFFLCISNIISIWIFFYFRALYLWAYGNSFGNAAKVTDQINLSKSIFAIIYEVFSVYGLIILSSSSFFALIIIFYRRQQGIKEIKFLIYSTVTIFLTIVPMTLLYSTTGTSDSRRIMIGISLFSLIILFYIGKEIIINKFLSIFIWLTFSIIFIFQSLFILGYTFRYEGESNLDTKEIVFRNRIDKLLYKKDKLIQKVNSFLKGGALVYRSPTTTKSYDKKVIKKLNSLGITNSKIAIFSLGMFAGNANYYQTESLKYSRLLLDPTLEFASFWAYTIYEYYLDVIRKMKVNSFQYVLIDDFKLTQKGELTNNLKSHTFFIYQVLDLINKNGANNIKGLKLVDKFSIGGREQYLFEISIEEFPKIISSSNLNSKLNANGILKERVPAWHSSSPPNYPEAIEIEFDNEREIQEIGFLPQIGHQGRGPKLIKIYKSEDGLNWKEINRSENICNSSFNEWKYVKLSNLHKTRHIKIEILSNCGTIDLLTIRGIKFK